MIQKTKQKIRLHFQTREKYGLNLNNWQFGKAIHTQEVWSKLFLF